MSDLKKLKEEFKGQFGSGRNIHLFQAPGRVNLIGEHTDYNNGFVLPVTIDRTIFALARARKDQIVRMKSINFADEIIFDLDNINYEKDSWGNYPKGVAFMLQNSGHKLEGLDILFASDIPIGAGLSSSAAIEVITAFMFARLSGINLREGELALLCQRAENEFVGVNCGIMDQFVATLGRKNKALYLDCRDLSYQLVPLELGSIKVVISNTGIKRSLDDSPYNQRRGECAAGVKILQKSLSGVKSLRDVPPEGFKRYQRALPEDIRRRCEHVIYENERVLRAVKSLRENNLTEFGSLMVQSHHSLRNLYEVSCPELDLLVECAIKSKGVLGARMTGAGFGGCTVSLVKEENINEFQDNLTSGYQEKTGSCPEFYICQTTDGVKEIEFG